MATCRALVDAAAWAPSEDAARTIIATTFQQRRVEADDVVGVLAGRRRLPRFALIKRTVLDVAGGAQAWSERRCAGDRDFPLRISSDRVRRFPAGLVIRSCIW